jgi:16S rRNA (guanine966-N2)-methyltransferase
VDVYLKSCKEKYDIIFLDPPYNKNLINPSLKLIYENELLNESGILIVEHSPKENIEVPYSDLINTEKYFKNTNFSWLDSKLYP